MTTISIICTAKTTQDALCGVGEAIRMFERGDVRGTVMDSREWRVEVKVVKVNEKTGKVTGE